MTVIIPNNLRMESRDFIVWCYKNIPGRPFTWKIYTNRIVFEYGEDALAFKLRFGL